MSGIIQKIINDYESIAGLNTLICLHNRDYIRFRLGIENLPHLLGLQYLVDIPILEAYAEKRITARTLYKCITKTNSKDYVNPNTFETSQYFEKLYNERIKYFNSTLVHDIITKGNIVSFNPSYVDGMQSCLDKIGYMFWMAHKCEGGVDHFGIGFSTDSTNNERNYPNTFFHRLDNKYVSKQIPVYPVSMKLTYKDKHSVFKVDLQNARCSMIHNPHYKYLLNHVCNNAMQTTYDFNVDTNNTDVVRHKQLLLLDELSEIYRPFLGFDFKWTNEEKLYILQLSNNMSNILPPNIVRDKINSYRLAKRQNH